MSSNNLEIEGNAFAAAASTATTMPESGSCNAMELSAELKASAEFWREFNLDTRRQELKRQCMEMIEAKTASSNGKKRLNEITKTFRAKTPDQQVASVLEVVRAYQEEIDQLSKRSKFSEAAFNGVYKALYDAPDPALLLDGMLEQVTSSSSSQLEIERLRNELRQYETEFQLLKNQDITIRRLEETIRGFENGNEDRIAEAVAVKVAEAEEHCATQVRDVKESHRALEKRLAGALESMKHAQASADRAQSQLFESSSQAESRISALYSENVMLAEHSSRSDARVAELERQVEDLKNSTSNTIPNTASGASTSKDESNQTLHFLVQELQQELRKKEEQFRSERQKLEVSHREVCSTLSSEREQLAKLTRDLNSRPTVEELVAVKRQLRVLQKIAFNVDDEDSTGDELSGHPEHTISGTGQLEILLSGKVKSLESELSEAKRELATSRDGEAANKESIRTLRASLDSSASLIARLEAELEQQTKVQVAGSGGNGVSGVGGSSIGSSSSQQTNAAELSKLLGVVMDPLDKSKVNNTTNFQTSGGSGLDSAGAADESSQMVVILQGQRDRYKDRMTKAESALFPLQQQLDSLNAIKTKLENDNLALYSELRYVKSITGSSSSSGMGRTPFSPTPGMKISSTSRRGGAAAPDEEWGDTAEREARYSKLYESRMSPFAQFSQFENQRKLAELSVADRVVLNTTMACVSSHNGRKFVLAYVITMHLLVFFTLYYTAHRVHCDPTVDHFAPTVAT